MGSGRLGNATSRLGRCDDSVVGALPKNSSPNFKGQRSRKHPTPTFLLVSVRCQDKYIVVLSWAGQDYEIVVRDLTAERAGLGKAPQTASNPHPFSSANSGVLVRKKSDIENHPGSL